MSTLNAHYVTDPGSDNQATVDLYIDNAKEIGGGSDPSNATTSTPGLVKQAASLDTISTADATSTASSETVDPTEFASVVALLNEVKAKVNSVISGEKTAGQMA